MVEVTVSDTGPGLAPVVAANLFQPFVTTKAKGMGLGLSICRSIMDAHGGGCGPPQIRMAALLSTSRSRPPDPRTTMTMSPENNGQETVFIVDDDDAVRDSLQILLESAGLRSKPSPRRWSSSNRPLPAGPAAC